MEYLTLQISFWFSFAIPRLEASASASVTYSGTYGTAIAIEAPTSARVHNISKHICVNAVLPKLEMRLFLNLVAIVG